jgi:hypothetical protein
MRFSIRTLAATCLAVGLLAGTSQAQTLFAGNGVGLTGSAHDFVKGAGSTGTGGTQWNATGQMCLPCHIPHLSSSANTTSSKGVYTAGATYVAGLGAVDSKGNLLGAALWNHTLDPAADGTFKLFSSWASNLTVSGSGTGATSAISTTSGVTSATYTNTLSGNVDQNTKLCLSCHDGNIALASFGVPHGATAALNGTITMNTFASFAVKGAGGDLTATHPIGDAATWSFPTNTAKFVDPATHAATGIVPLRPMANGNLAVGCSSCHDPHNTAGNDHFLWVNNTIPGTTDDGRQVNGSLLCQNCHVK